LTPYSGEIGRLTGLTHGEIDARRLDLAPEKAKRVGRGRAAPDGSPALAIAPTWCGDPDDGATVIDQVQLSADPPSVE